jgi:WD40-like Beta Propeller Repeat
MKTFTLSFVVAIAAAIALPPGGLAATSGSILHLKAGKLWVTSPTGARARRVPHKGGFANPSQADNGTIVAQRGVYLHRLNRRGRLLNKPITTAFRTSRLLPAVKGPFWPEVSPDGRRITYTYSLTAAQFDPSCMCMSVAPSLNTSYTWSNRFTEPPQRVFGLARMYAQASWVGNSSVVMATPNLFDYAGNVLDSLAVDRLGGGEDSYTRWFSECDPCDSLQTLRLYRIAEPEVTRKRDKLVVVSGDLGGGPDGTRMLIYRLRGMPPAIPGTPCHVTGAAGRFSSPSWSPDGNSLAWQDNRGIWVGRLGDISGPTCQITRRLIVPRGSAPDWGPAKP